MRSQLKDLVSLLHSVDDVLRGVDSGRGAALVDRTCPLGTINRGTQATASAAASLVAFLSLDLEFSPYEVPQALDSMAAALKSGLPPVGWDCEVHIVDGECRGGLWAALRCRRRNPASGTTTGGSHDLVAGTTSTEACSSGQPPSNMPSEGDSSCLVRVFLAENMSSSVAAARQVKAGPPAAADAEAAVGSAGAGGGESGAGSEVGPVPWLVDSSKAQEQQRNLLGQAERRLHRLHKPGRRSHTVGDEAAVAAWVARVSCGVAEAQRLFWSRQPQTVLRAARSVQTIWRRTVEGQQGGSVNAPGGRGDGSAGAPDDVTVPPLSDDPVLHLLDVLALHVHGEVQGGVREAPVDAEAGAAPEEGVVVKRLLTVLAGEGNAVLRVALPRGVLSAGDEAGEAAGGGAEGQAAVGGEPAGLVVLDPCFPVHDLYAAACKAVAPVEGGEAAGVEVLQRLAGQALGTLA